ncbi:hypothetical protein FDZ14_25775 [Priestia megaterium]|uniref:Uncharacterized protein n=1 Tax=Priestia megaterium TaxID=1404 RepID=A0A6M6E184_PRIMG|nr:hypothetical protein OEA_26310 [Priestia megaterium NCT-2]QJX79404.1 hypothetical protein FDZ14_25775 [Priestia megaterium]
MIARIQTVLRKIATFTINVGTTSVIGHTGSAKYKRLHNCVFLGIAVRHLDRVVSDIYEVL